MFPAMDNLPHMDMVDTGGLPTFESCSMEQNVQ